MSLPHNSLIYINYSTSLSSTTRLTRPLIHPEKIGRAYIPFCKFTVAGIVLRNVLLSGA